MAFSTASSLPSRPRGGWISEYSDIACGGRGEGHALLPNGCAKSALVAELGFINFLGMLHGRTVFILFNYVLYDPHTFIHTYPFPPARPSIHPSNNECPFYTAMANLHLAAVKQTHEDLVKCGYQLDNAQRTRLDRALAILNYEKKAEDSISKHRRRRRLHTFLSSVAKENGAGAAFLCVISVAISQLDEGGSKLATPFSNWWKQVEEKDRLHKLADAELTHITDFGTMSWPWRGSYATYSLLISSTRVQAVLRWD